MFFVQKSRFLFDTNYLCNMKWHKFHTLGHTMSLFRLLALSFVLLMAEGDAYSQLRKETKREPLINEWGIGYGAGSPFGATEWRSVKNSEFTQKFSQMWQLNIGHQFTSKDYGQRQKDITTLPSVCFFNGWTTVI